MNKWWVKDKRKFRDVIKKLGGDGEDKYDRTSDKIILEFDSKVAENYQVAIVKGRGRIKNLSFEDSGRAIRLITGLLEKTPDLNYNKTPSGPNSNLKGRGRILNARRVLWGVNIEDGIEASNMLVAAGITEFKITPSGWLTINIPKDAYVSSFLTSEDPAEWKRKNDSRRSSLMTRLHGQAIQDGRDMSQFPFNEEDEDDTWGTP